MVQQGRAVQAEGYLAVTPDGRAAQLRSGAGAIVLGVPPKVLRVVAIGEERQVGEVDHGRTQLAQGRQQTRLAQREGRALRPRLRPSRRAGHADDRDLAAGHESSIVLGRTPPRT